MKTIETEVEGTVSIWAEPKSAWRVEQEIEAGDPNPFPFEYTLRTTKPYGAGCVNVYEHPLTLMVPPDINLLAKAVETLNASIAEERKDSALRIAELQGHINRLLQLEFKPEPEEKEVEVLPPEDTPLATEEVFHGMKTVVGNDPDA